MPPLVVFVAVLTFVHYVAAQMRGPVLPLYASAHDASASAVGVIIGAHMLVAAVGSIPLGRAADVWGRRPLLLAGITVSAVTSLLLPFARGDGALALVYGLAGLGVAAFSPSALAMIGDIAPRDRIAQAFGWYSTAHYGAVAVGPFLGGLTAEWYGYHTTFFASGVGAAVALAIGAVWMRHGVAAARPTATTTFADIQGNTSVWAGWIVSLAGLTIQGTVFTFFPLLADARGLTPSRIGLVFLVLGLANTLIRVPAGWLIDRTQRPHVYAVVGVLVACASTAVLPYLTGFASVLLLVAAFGAVSGIAFVAISVGLTAASTPATRGLVMGGYSTSLYGGLAVGSFGFGPIVSHAGYQTAFIASGAAAAVGALVAAMLWATSTLTEPRPAVRSGTS